MAAAFGDESRSEPPSRREGGSATVKRSLSRCCCCCFHTKGSSGGGPPCGRIVGADHRLCELSSSTSSCRSTSSRLLRSLSTLPSTLHLLLIIADTFEEMWVVTNSLKHRRKKKGGGRAARPLPRKSQLFPASSSPDLSLKVKKK